MSPSNYGSPLCPRCHGSLMTDFAASEIERCPILACTSCGAQFDLIPLYRPFVATPDPMIIWDDE